MRSRAARVTLRTGMSGAAVLAVLESLATHADRPVLSTPERAAESSIVLRTRRDEEDVKALERYGWRVTKLELPRVLLAYPP